MTARVLLVTGSRSLVSRGDWVGIRDWVYDAIQGAASRYGVETIVCGDAAGPDAWALECAYYELGIRSACYRAQDGEVWITSPVGDAAAGRWITADELARIEPAKRPLARNSVMVRHVQSKDPKAIVLGFVDPMSRTQGTDHTLRNAKERGLVCTRLVAE